MREERPIVDHDLKFDFNGYKGTESKYAYFKNVFDNMRYQPLESMLKPEDILALHTLFIDPEFSSKPRVRQLEIADTIFESRGFKRSHSGTNRIVYASTDHPTIVLKVAVDEQGLADNEDEMYNQDFLKPFVPKVYEVSECNTVQLVERVQPFKSRQDLWNNKEEVFNILFSFTHIQKYLVEDIGSSFFMNWGIRQGFGPVILDYPYIYKYDESKSRCVAVDKNTGALCGGRIWYNDSMDQLVCQKCGQRYSAKDIGKPLIKTQVTTKEIFDMYGADEFDSYNEFDNVIIKGFEAKDPKAKVQPRVAEDIITSKPTFKKHEEKKTATSTKPVISSKIAKDF